jgi:hypothetical protein
MPIKLNNGKMRKSCIIKVKPNLQKSGANGLIGAISAPLGDFFGEYFWIIFIKKVFKKIS